MDRDQQTNNDMSGDAQPQQQQQSPQPPPVFDGAGQFTVAFRESEGPFLFPSGCAPGVVYGLLCTDCVEIIQPPDNNVPDNPDNPDKPTHAVPDKAYAATFAFVPFARTKTDPKSGLILPGGGR